MNLKVRIGLLVLITFCMLVPCAAEYSFPCKASEPVSLLIVADQLFLDELEPLAEWKNRTGMPTIIVSWQDLDAAYPGRDAPERIKRGIVDLEARLGVQYVMLVGDNHNFPVRYQITDRAERIDTQTGLVTVAVGAYFGCDLYYADLYDETGSFDTWDFDGDGYYGELWGEYYDGHINQDRVSLVPDVAVGRVPASDEAEVTNYVDKVLHYERNLIPDTETWVSNALFIITTPEFPSYLTAKENTIDDYTGFTFLHNKPTPTFWRMYNSSVSSTTDYVLNPATIISLINNPGIGLINFGGHGWQRNEVTDINYHCGMAGGIATWDMLQLTTLNYPVVFSSGCGNGRFTVEPPYDPYVCEFGVNHVGTDWGEIFSTTSYPPKPDPLQPRICPGGNDEVDSFGEYGLVRREMWLDSTRFSYPDRGFIAFIGCVTGAQNPIGELDEYFLQAFYSWHGLEKRLGNLWNHAIESYCDEHGYGRGEYSKTAGSWVDVAAYHMPMKVLLFGDPSLRVGGLPHYPPTLLPTLGGTDPIYEGGTFHFAPYVSFTDVEDASAQYRIDSHGDGGWDTEWGGDGCMYHDDFEGDARVQASDGEYYSEVVEVHVTVYNVAPSPTVTIPVTDMEEDMDYTYTFNAGDPGDDIFTYYVDWDGDDTWDETRSDADHILSLKHSYDTSGTYTMKVKVQDDDGGEGSASETVTIDPRGRVYDFWRRISELGGGSEFVGLGIFTGIITFPSLFSVLAWVKLPKWWRGCPMAARVAVTLLPLIVMAAMLIALDIIPVLNMLGLK